VAAGTPHDRALRPRAANVSAIYGSTSCPSPIVDVAIDLSPVVIASKIAGKINKEINNKKC
jgi:hypothetical protein